MQYDLLVVPLRVPAGASAEERQTVVSNTLAKAQELVKQATKDGYTSTVLGRRGRPEQPGRRIRRLPHPSLRHRDSGPPRRGPDRPNLRLADDVDVQRPDRPRVSSIRHRDAGDNVVAAATRGFGL